MRKYLLFFGIVVLLLLPTPRYLELNHLKIIDSVSLSCFSNYYEISLSEVIPNRDDNSIKLESNKTSYKTSNLYELKEILEKDHYYLRHSNVFLDHCVNIDEISYILKVSKSKIKRK